MSIVHIRRAELATTQPQRTVIADPRNVYDD